MIDLSVGHLGDGSYFFACVLRGGSTMVNLLRFSAVINYNITIVVDPASFTEVKLDSWVLTMKIIVVTLVKTVSNVVAKDGYSYRGSHVFE